MSEHELLQIISQNLMRLLSEHKMNIAELAARMGVSHTAASNWVNGLKMPRADKLDAMCRVFGVSREDIITKTPTDESTRLAQELKENPKYGMLLKTVKELTPEDFAFLCQLAEKMRNKQ